MLIKRQTTLINSGTFSKTPEFQSIIDEIHNSIKKVVWPLDSDKFIIYPESGKKRGEGNGVKPIKNVFIKNLNDLGWKLEHRIDIATVKKPGPIDATRKIGSKYFAVEWETGNISSSHRAMNKMAIGLLKGILIGGILIIPSNNLAPYLTDRIGNYPELEPYFPLWKSINCENGYFGVIEIEHDGTSIKVPRIEKGTDGRAKI